MQDRAPFSTHNFAIVVVRNFDGRWLAIKETRGRGWWLPAGLVEPGETFIQAASRKALDEAGINVEFKGILRVEHSVYGPSHARMRVVFYAVPQDKNAQLKSTPTETSEEARWVTLNELRRISRGPGLRGPELYEWGTYLEKGGLVAPLHFLCREDEPSPNAQSTFFRIAEPQAPRGTIQSLVQAIEHGDEPRARQLLMGDLEVNLPINDKLWTPLHLACKLGHEGIVYALLLSGADPTLMTHKKRNTLHVAVQTNVLIMRLLLIRICRFVNKVGIVNLQDEEGNTPLHYCAAIKGQGDIWDLLIEYGADVSLMNVINETPSDLLTSNPAW